MFVAIDQFGNKVNPLDTTEEELRLLSKSKLLFCPECQTVVKFASGEHVTAHFKHANSPDCTYESEPETEEHLKGKMLLRNWLVKRYSDVHVEFEYKIKETNQRADVMAFFPGGQRIAFEMQCSKIQGSIWKERHALYKKAGIKDLWILGQSVHKYGKTNGKEDTDKHQLVSLASTIYQQEGATFFLDTDTASIRGLYKHKFKYWHSDTILKLDEEIYPLVEAKIYKNFIGTESIKNDFKAWYIEELRKEEIRKKEEAEYLREQEERERAYAQNAILREKQMKQYLSKLHSTTLADVKEKMTGKERELFERLLKKHGFNDDNFSGIFNVNTPSNFLIFTPHQLWQLWIYDKYIYRKKQTYGKIWVPRIKDEFYKMYERGIFRFKYKSGDLHYSFAIYAYFERLNQLGIVQRLGLHNAKYYKIYCDVLPPLTGKEVHGYIAYYLSTQHDSSFSHTQDIKDAFYMYSAMIGKNREERQGWYKEKVSVPKEKAQLQRKASTLQYTHNLLEATPELATEQEKEFISEMLGLQKSGYKLTDKQQTRVNSIVKRVENQFGISLS